MIDAAAIKNICDYIQQNWEKCVRTNQNDVDTLIGMPHSYVVPCIKGSFQEMYYWDTYFTNQGLLIQELQALVKSNTDNILYLVDRYGFMPNGNRTYYLNRSQPPYLSMMVRDVFEVYKDIDWLRNAYNILKKEYDFWMTHRCSKSGLNHYYQHAEVEDLLGIFQGVQRRLKCEEQADEFRSEEDRKIQGAHYMAECESGWDFNPRFEGRCADFNPVDLNSNLYLYENNFAWFSEKLNNGEKDLWAQRAETRRNLMNRYSWDAQKGLFMDYDYVNDKQSSIASLASFHPLWAGLASREQAEAARKNLKRFEYDFGLSTCEAGERKVSYQWDYPNGWAPLHYIVMKGLLNYGFTEDAKRIGYKYIELCVKNFEATSSLWEKYNVIDGTIQSKGEYEPPAMLGWTAGVFVYAATLVEI